MRAAPSISAVAALALAACAGTPKPDLRVPAAYEAPAGPPAGALALDQWWTAFDDPQLTQLIDQALVANPDAWSAAARLKEAQASRASILAQFLPQGELKGATARTENNQIAGTVINIPGFSTSGVSQTSSANLNINWELDLVGRVFGARRAANADVAAARFNYEATRASLAAQVADAYFQARGYAIQLADARETARIEQGLYEVAAKRAKAGLAPTSDPDRIAGDLAQALSQAQTLDAELQVERRTLLILAGRTIEPTANIDVPPMVGVAPGVPATLPSELLQRRPDVRQAEAQLVSSLGQRDLARLAFFPTFNFTPGAGWQAARQPGFSFQAYSWTLAGAFAQPVLDIPKLLADLHVQDARAEQAAAAYEKTVQTAFGEAEASLVRLDADRKRVEVLTEGEARAARAYRAQRIGYGLGLIDLTTTLSAEQSWRVIRASLTSAQVQTLRGAVQAYKAVGGGWPAGRYPALAQAAH